MSKSVMDNLAVLMTPENVQRYILGTKKNGTPRAVYDIIRDCYGYGGKKKKKKHKKNYYTAYDLYFDVDHKKKKKKKKKNKDFWHI